MIIYPCVNVYGMLAYLIFVVKEYNKVSFPNIKNIIKCIYIVHELNICVHFYKIQISIFLYASFCI